MSLQLNSYLALHSPKIQGIRSKKENLGRADALKAFFWGGGTYYRLVRNQLSRGQGYP